MPWGAAAIIGGAVIGGIASNSAANTQADAANNATNMQLGEFNTINQQNTPWRQAGQQALSSLGDFMGTSGNTGADNYGLGTHQFSAQDLNSNLAPNYQFQLQQGEQAFDRRGSAMGGQGGTGNFETGLQNYVQGTAAGAYQQAFQNYTANQTNIYNRLSNLAGLGQTANQTTAQAGTNLVGNAGNYLTQAGNANAAGTIGVANAISNGLNGAAGWNYLNSNPQTNIGGSFNSPLGGWTDPNNGVSYNNPSAYTPGP